MAGGTGRRWLARACLLGACACLPLGVLDAVAAQGRDEPVPPDVYRSAASAMVASVVVDPVGLLPIQDVLRIIVLDGEASYEAGTQRARASLLYPGNGVVSGPNLLCSTFGAQFPAQLGPLLDLCTRFSYPLSVVADTLTPEASTPGALALGARGDPLSGEALGASARATAEATTTDAAIGGLRLLGLPGLGALDLGGLPIPGLPSLDPSLLTVDAATSRTDQHIDGDGVLRVRAEATLEGLSLVGGLVRIGTLRSVSTVSDDGRGELTHDADLHVAGVSVAGVPARVTDEGLELGRPGGSGPLLAQLSAVVGRLLRGLGVELRLLDVEEGIDDDGAAFARAEGLLIELGVDVMGLPIVPGPLGDLDLNTTYVASLQLARTGARGTAAVIEPPSAAPPAPTPPPAVGGDGALVPGGIPGPAAPDPGVTEPGTAPVPTTATTAPELVRTVRSGEDLDADLRWLYVSFSLMALGLAISAPLTLPSRLPSPPPRSVP